MLLSFVMVPLIQKELDVFRETVWNTHRIRMQKETTLPNGIPNHIYSFPEEYDLEQCGKFFMLQGFINMNNIYMFKFGLWCTVHQVITSDKFNLLR